MKQILIAALLAAAGGAFAQATPAGLWKTIDDQTQKERSLIRISETGGVYTGRIEKSLDPGDKPGAVCDKCSDERRGQPLIGMTLLRNMRPAADDKGGFDGGDIIDPGNGKVYRLRLRLQDGGKKLEVRGYIGMPLLGRTQTWLRVE